MAKTQGIVRLRGSIDGVTYTEGVNGRLSRSKSSLNKAKMDANPKFRTLRLLQSELGSYSKFGALLRSGIKGELARVKPYRGVQRLNKLLNTIKNEDTVNRLGERNVATGLDSARGRNLLLQFDFYGKSNVFSLLQRDFVVDFALGEARIDGFNPMVDLIAPTTATHVRFKSVFIGIDQEQGMVSAKRSPEIYLPLTTVVADLVLQTEGLPLISNRAFYLVQILFYQEINGFSELTGLDSAALTVIDIGV